MENRLRRLWEGLSVFNNSFYESKPIKEIMGKSASIFNNAQYKTKSQSRETWEDLYHTCQGDCGKSIGNLNKVFYTSKIQQENSRLGQKLDFQGSVKYPQTPHNLPIFSISEARLAVWGLVSIKKYSALIPSIWRRIFKTKNRSNALMQEPEVTR